VESSKNAKQKKTEKYSQDTIQKKNKIDINIVACYHTVKLCAPDALDF